jgi:hypothetical protein
MSYDSKKKTSTDDVRKEVAEAATEVAEAVSAVVDYVADSETFGKVKKWFRSKLGYQLHDPEQGVAIKNEPTEAKETSWVKAQKAAGLIEEVDPPVPPRG